jgi:formylglycine-generating enzyme required for sulfatase activity
MKSARLPLLILLCMLPLWVCAETLVEALGRAERFIAQRYPTEGLAKTRATQELVAIDNSDKSETEKVAAIQQLIAEWDKSEVKTVEIDSDGDGILDNRDPQPLVMDSLPITVVVDSIALAWDLDQKYEQVETVQTELRQLQATESGYGGRLSLSTAAGVDANASLSANPFTLFGLSSAKASGYFRAGFEAKGEAHWSRSNRESSEAMAQIMSRYSAVFSGFHLVFILTFFNPGEKDYMVTAAELPVDFGGQTFVMANPTRKAEDRFMIPARRPDGMKVMYRAELNNTRALELVRLMSKQAPEINVLNSGMTALPAGGGEEALSLMGIAAAKTLPITLSTRTGTFLNLRVAREKDGRPLTVKEAMDAVNAMVNDDQGKPLFKFNSAGDRLVGIGIQPITAVDGHWQIAGNRGQPIKVAELDLSRAFNEPLMLDYFSYQFVMKSVPGLDIDLLPVPAGRFQMGSDSGESNEKPVHEVQISRPYWMGKTEVTQRQWQAIMGNNPSEFKGDNLPVENVSWTDAVSFCTKLTEREQDADRLPECYVYRLPTEAEWEYAARGGDKSKGYEYSGSSTLADVAWYTDNSGRTTHPVGQKKPNEIGLHDMSGNVWEWCLDWYGDYPAAESVDPFGPATGTDQVDRGGSWVSPSRDCRSTNRDWNAPAGRDCGLGFRVVLAPVRPRE